MNALEKFLDDNHLTINKFATMCLVCRQTIERICNGGKCRIDTARRIVMASGRKISMQDLGHGRKKEVVVEEKCL